MNEHKNITNNLLSLMFSISILLNGLCFLCFTWLARYPVFNEYTIYVQALMPILMNLFVLSVIVVFICKYKKLTEKCRNWICIILITLLSILWTVASIGYLKDIFVEPLTISSDYYYYNKNLIIYNETDGSDIVLKINDKKHSELLKNELKVDKTKKLKVSEHLSVCGMEKTIFVEYYPNTFIVKNIEFISQ